MGILRTVLRTSPFLGFCILVIPFLAAFPTLGERLWGENGRIVFGFDQYQVVIDPVLFPDGGHSILIESPVSDDTTAGGPYLEGVSDEEGNLVAIYRLPEESVPGVLHAWLPSAEGNQFLLFFDSESQEWRLLALDNDRTFLWQTTIPFSFHGYEENLNPGMELADGNLLVWLWEGSGALGFRGYDPDTGDEQFYEILHEARGESFTLYSLDDTHFLVAAVNDDGILQIWSVSADGDITSLGTCEEVEGETKSLNILDGYIVREADLPDQFRIELYNWQAEWLDELITGYNNADLFPVNDPIGFVRITDRLGFDDMLCNFTIEENEIQVGPHVDMERQFSCRYLLPSGDILLREYSTRRFHCYSPQGQHLWQVQCDDDYDVWPVANDNYLFVYNSKKDKRYQFEMGSGYLMQNTDGLLGLRLLGYSRHLYLNSLVAGKNGNVWLSWYYTGDGLSRTRPVGPDGESGTMIDPVTIGNTTTPYPDHDGGVWTMSYRSYRHFDVNGEPYMDEEVAFPGDGFNFIGAVCDCSEGPYPILCRFEMERSDSSAGVVFVDDAGQQVGDLEKIREMPSYLYYDFHRPQCFMEGNRLYFAYRADMDMNTCHLWSLDRETRERTTFIDGAPGNILGMCYWGTSLCIIHYQDSQVYLERYNVETGQIISSFLLRENIENHWHEHFIPENYVMADISVASLFQDDEVCVVYRHQNSVYWEVARFTLNGTLSAGPVVLTSTMGDTVIGIYNAPDNGVWITTPTRVYLLDNTLSIAEGYNQGIPFADSEPDLYVHDYWVHQKHIAGTSDGDLVGIWQERYEEEIILMQRFRASWYNNSPELETSQLPSSPSIDTVWPNPFNSELRIRFTLPEAGSVRINVYNIQGQRVAQLDGGVKQRGEMNWHPSPNLASGLYFLRLEGEEPATCKVLYQK